MPDNRNFRVPNSSDDQSVDNLQETIRRLRIQTSHTHDVGGGGASGAADMMPYPDRPGEPDCSYYMRTGTCRYGPNCRFNHPSDLGQIRQYTGGELPQRVGEPDCEYFLKTGTCKYGSSCKYNHPPDRHGAGPLVLNTLGLPMRQDEKPCPYYMRTRDCKFKIACKFHHPQPTKDVPVQGPGAYGSTGLFMLPSSGGLPSWSQNATYLSAPASQGIVTAPGWSTYMGSLSGLLPPSPTMASHLPERPDKQECRHFMRTGNCKYGLNCQYNHPKQKIAQLAASSLGPLGLPLRPGQEMCLYYAMYGLCKYGPTCKYDHPFVGYSYNHNLNLPAVFMPADPSVLPYQRSSPMIHSYETSPSKSPKYPDLMGKFDGAGNRNWNAKSSEESPEPAESAANSGSALAEQQNNHSD